jgi:membrane associated rhomboid family serine protease
MIDIGITGAILIVANITFSYKGFVSEGFFNKYKFEVDKILVNKEYVRLITSSFLHADWLHLTLNMLGIYMFSGLLENTLGEVSLLLIYFASMVGGDMFALYIHRNHGDYSAIGASGAVFGIIFSSIVLYPELERGFFLLPIFIPIWLHGIIYVVVSIYGIKSRKDNIGHEAHLGGLLTGMIITLLMVPSALYQNYIPISLIIIPTIAFIALCIVKPNILLFDGFSFGRQTNYASVDDKYNEAKSNKRNEIDRILDKVGKKGMNSLSDKEKERLKEYSNKI